MENLSKIKFGIPLAEKVADKLETGKILANSHRDYCGDGLIYENGIYRWITIYDSHMFTDRITWNKKKKFIYFLSEQSDYTCSGGKNSPKQLRGSNFELNNQRITKKRLSDFISK